MRATYFLFPHGGEQEVVIDEFGSRVRNLPRRSEGAEHALILSFTPVPHADGWPQGLRCMTDGIDPELVVHEFYATQWQHEVRFMYRTDEDNSWSFITLEHRPPLSEG